VSLVSVAELMSDPEFMSAVTLRRAVVHMANEGEAISSYTDTEVTASVQPATAVEIDSIEIGERGSGRIVSVYSATEFKDSNGKTTIADLVVVGGTRPGTFRVVGVEPWGDNGYFKALAVEIVK
jgi:hypothetical protein